MLPSAVKQATAGTCPNCGAEKLEWAVTALCSRNLRSLRNMRSPRRVSSVAVEKPLEETRVLHLSTCPLSEWKLPFSILVCIFHGFISAPLSGGMPMPSKRSVVRRPGCFLVSCMGLILGVHNIDVRLKANQQVLELGPQICYQELRHLF